MLLCYITLHYCLEWLEYKTAKPLLFTVQGTKTKIVNSYEGNDREERWVLRQFRKTVLLLIS